MLNKILIVLVCIHILNITFAQTIKPDLPNGFSQSQWLNIQSQVNQKSLPQTNGVFEQNYLKASNVDENAVVGDGGDAFGASVAIDGDTLVIGGRFEDGIDDGTEDNNGAAYVFVKSNGIWQEQAYLKANNPIGVRQFGHAVAISGNTIIVSSPLEGGNSGAIYVYTRTGENWNYQTTLKASNPETGDKFGWSISIEGDTIVGGAFQEDGDDSGSQGDAGAAYVFSRTGGVWSSGIKLVASNIGAEDNFGVSVSVSNNAIVVGANQEDGLDDGNQDDSGAAYSFIKSGGVWTFNDYLKAPTIGAGDSFGISVGVSNNSVVVGADGESNGQGSAYVFVVSGSNLAHQATLKASNFGNGDHFGVSVSIDENQIIVGAKFEDDTFFNSGAGYYFTRSGTTWSQQNFLKASNIGDRDEFGTTVAISGSTMIVGAPSEDSAVTDNPNNNFFLSNTGFGAGAAYVFSPPDLVFSDGFEQAVVVKLFNYLNAIKSNSALSQHPIYDLETHSIEFYGHVLKLKNNYHKKDIVEIVKFWLHEVLIKEGLSSQYGLGIIFE